MGKLLENQNVDYTPAGVLAQATGDVMDNIFDVKIVWPEGFDVKGVTDAEVSYRCDGFNPPDVESARTKYGNECTYVGLIHADINGAITVTRNVTENGIDPNVFEYCLLGAIILFFYLSLFL